MSLITQSSAPRVRAIHRAKQGSHAARYSSKRVSQVLLKEISSALKSIDTHGSVEIYVQNASITQITVRNIKKTNGVHTQNN